MHVFIGNLAEGLAPKAPYVLTSFDYILFANVHYWLLNSNCIISATDIVSVHSVLGLGTIDNASFSGNTPMNHRITNNFCEFDFLILDYYHYKYNNYLH